MKGPAGSAMFFAMDLHSLAHFFIYSFLDSLMTETRMLRKR